MEAIRIIQELRQATGLNAKKALLQEHRSDSKWLQVLKAMYDNSINYYVSAPVDDTFIADPLDYHALFTDLQMLSSRAYTGNGAKEFAGTCSRKYGEIFRLILGRSMKAGVSIKTLNKVYPGLIPEFRRMKGKAIPITEYPVIASTKYDGVYVNVKVTGSGALIRTSSGKVLADQLLRASMIGQPAGVYEGELVFGDGLQAARSSITGAVNKVLLGSTEEIPGATYCIYDFIPLREWDAKLSQTNYIERMKLLWANLKPCANIMIGPQVRLENKDQVAALFAERLANGFEGIMCRYADDLYAWTRTPRIIKQKANNECVLRCTGIEEGRNKYSGMVGALILEGKVKGIPVTVKVGSGLSDFDRTQPPEHYQGMDIEVLYNTITEADTAGVASLFLPRFKRKAINKDV